jgi:hypothetical protein
MTEKEPPAGGKDAETMGVADPYDLKGVLKRLGGSQSDHWNRFSSIKPFKHSGSGTRIVQPLPD